MSEIDALRERGELPTGVMLEVQVDMADGEHYLSDAGDGTHYTRTDTLPRWRTVGVDGMPRASLEVHAVFREAWGNETWVGVKPMWTDGNDWVNGSGILIPPQPTDRYIPLSELTRLPGGAT